MATVKDRVHKYFVKRYLDADLDSIGRLKAIGIKALRFCYVILRELTEEQLVLRAMSLVYTTLLSLVPILAVSFSVLKAFGVHAKFEIFLYYLLEPLGDKGVDVAYKLIEFVERVNVSVLGAIGLSMLVYTVLSQVQKIESALNYIWHVKNTRNFARRFSNYMSVLLVGPVLIFSGVGLTASFMSTAFVHKLIDIKILGIVIYYIGRIMPYILISAAFTFAYVFLPNTKVHFKSALVGGVFSGVVWKLTGMAFAAFIVSSAQYSAIYSGFALLVLFLIWLYWSWLILFVGARVSFYHQYPEFIDVRKEAFLLSSSQKERLAVMIMYLIGDSFYNKKQSWKFDPLVERLRFPAGAIEEVLNVLEKKGLIISTGEEPPAYYPARDIETISVKEVLDSVRLSAEDAPVAQKGFLSIPEVERTIKHMDDAISHSIEKETIKTLILSKKK